MTEIYENIGELKWFVNLKMNRYIIPVKVIFNILFLKFY